VQVLNRRVDIRLPLCPFNELVQLSRHRSGWRRILGPGIDPANEQLFILLGATSPFRAVHFDPCTSSNQLSNVRSGNDATF
jgi:hypothetical protein